MNQTGENISKMEMNIKWHKPRVATPPFETPILAVIGGGISHGGPAVLYRYVTTIVIHRDGPNGDDPHEAYMFAEEPWDDLQFYVLTYEQHLEQADPEMDCDLYSDSILLWAPVPDLGAV